MLKIEHLWENVSTNLIYVMEDNPIALPLGDGVHWKMREMMESKSRKKERKKTMRTYTMFSPSKCQQY